jgi:hypothetical protein
VFFIAGTGDTPAANDLTPMDSFRQALGYLAFALLTLTSSLCLTVYTQPSGFIALRFSAGPYAHKPGKGTVAEFVGAPITYLARPLHSLGVTTMRSDCLPFSQGSAGRSRLFNSMML